RPTSAPWRRSPTGGRPRSGRTGPTQRGEIWFAATPGGDRPVLVLTRDPVADRIRSVVVAALTRPRQGLSPALDLSTVRHSAQGVGLPGAHRRARDRADNERRQRLPRAPVPRHPERVAVPHGAGGARWRLRFLPEERARPGRCSR